MNELYETNLDYLLEVYKKELGKEKELDEKEEKKQE